MLTSSRPSVPNYSTVSMTSSSLTLYVYLFGMLRAVAARMTDMEITMTWTDAAKKHLAKAGFDPIYGARPLRRAIQSQVEDLVAEEFLKGTIARGQSVVLDEQDDKLTLHPADAEPAAPTTEQGE